MAAVVQSSLLDRVLELLRADDASIGSAAVPCRVTLYTNENALTDSMTISDFVEPVTAGLEFINCAAGQEPNSYVDAESGQRTIELTAPVGGFHWQAEEAPAETEYVRGYYVTYADSSPQVAFAEQFDSPYVIENIDDGFSLDKVSISLSQVAFS